MNNKKCAVLFTLLGGITLCAIPVLAQSPMTPVPFANGRIIASHFEKIQLQHYDAAMMADLITRPSGIIVVPPNFVYAAASVNTGAFPLRTGAVSNPAPAVSAGSAPVLPKGITRIYALESDNSLVIETAP